MPVPYDPEEIQDFQPATKLPFMIQSVTMLPDHSMEIQYINDETDVKANGAVHVHHLLVPPVEDYRDNIIAIRNAASFLVADVLQDWDNLDAEPME